MALNLNSKKLITYAWFSALFFVFILFIVAIATAAENDAAEDGSKSAGFSAVFLMLLCTGLSVGGTMVMRKYQTPLAVGFFLGTTTMMSQTMFTSFVLFAGLANDAADGEGGADKAMAAFCFFLFMCYTIFSILLAKYRHDVIKDDTLAGQDGFGGDIANPAAAAGSPGAATAGAGAGTTAGAPPMAV